MLDLRSANGKPDFENAKSQKHKEPEMRLSGSSALGLECMLKDPSTQGSFREERSFTVAGALPPMSMET